MKGIKRNIITILLVSIIYSQGSIANNYTTDSPSEINEGNSSTPSIIKSNNKIAVPQKIRRNNKETDDFIKHIEKEVEHQEENMIRKVISNRYVSFDIDKNNNLTLHLTEEITNRIDNHLKLTHPGYNAGFSNFYSHIINNQNEEVKKSIIKHLSSISESNQLVLDNKIIEDVKNNNINELYIKVKKNDMPLSESILLNEKIDKHHLTPEEIDKYLKNEIDNSNIITLGNYIMNNDVQIKANEIIDALESGKENIENNTHSITENQSSISINKSNIVENTLKANQALGENVIQDLAIEENEKLINLNSDGITRNKIDINDNNEKIKTNTDEIEKNKHHISHLEFEYLEYLNIKEFGKKNIKDHFGKLYMENSIARDDINKLDSKFKHFKHETNNRFYKVEKRANQGIASVAAMSNLPFTDTATFSTAIGIGNYRNATALAWGMQYRINENIKVRASTAWNDSNNFVSAGGIGISW
ncbi:YadA C-terminal domain-containing protein [Proteus penneri]|uniref:Adhesin YadA n=1 Tax=Proteus penneri TaxID=102862 RepID=A0A0G4QI35_9GAMM|nr:YadA C-terminal domain-containing protein [Proteus penneri]CRL65289.1 Adhesin YadA precursor [Proteus penneri]